MVSTEDRRLLQLWAWRATVPVNTMPDLRSADMAELDAEEVADHLSLCGADGCFGTAGADGEVDRSESLSERKRGKVNSVVRISRDDIFNEIKARSLGDGLLDEWQAAELIEVLHFVERHNGLHTTALEKAAKQEGLSASGMRWKLACLALCGVVKYTRGTAPNFPTYWHANTDVTMRRPKQ